MTVDSRAFANGFIPHSQVTLVLAERRVGAPIPLFLVTIKVQLSGGTTKEIRSRYDLGKRVFIDVFPDDEIMYQLRRVELAVGERLAALFSS